MEKINCEILCSSIGEILDFVLRFSHSFGPDKIIKMILKTI